MAWVACSADSIPGNMIPAAPRSRAWPARMRWVDSTRTSIGTPWASAASCWCSSSLSSPPPCSKSVSSSRTRPGHMPRRPARSRGRGTVRTECHLRPDARTGRSFTGSFPGCCERRVNGLTELRLGEPRAELVAEEGVGGVVRRAEKVLLGAVPNHGEKKMLGTVAEFDVVVVDDSVYTAEGGQPSVQVGRQVPGLLGGVEVQAFEVHVQHVVLGVVDEAVVEVHQGVAGQAHRLLAGDAGIHLPQIGGGGR